MADISAKQKLRIDPGYEAVDGFERCLTITEVATILRVSNGWVRDHTTRYEPKLPGVRRGKSYIYPESRIREFLRQLGIRGTDAVSPR